MIVTNLLARFLVEWNAICALLVSKRLSTSELFPWESSGNTQSILKGFSFFFFCFFSRRLSARSSLICSSEACDKNVSIEGCYGYDTRRQE